MQAQNYGTVASRKLHMAEFAINNLYVDKVNEDKLVEDAIVKMLSTLDPHSTYANSDEVKKMNEPLQGNFEGIGVTFQILKDTVMVLEVIPGGPSNKVGLQAGDKIVKVNDTTIAGIKIETGVVPNEDNENPTEIMVPASAIFKRGQLSGIYVVNDKNIALLRWIRTGKSSGDMISVESGLSANETYILEADGRVYNGAQVKISN